MADVFVSYRNEDRERAGRLVCALEAAGLAVWWDQQLEAGAGWRAEIAARLEDARCVVVLWSRRSAGADGRFVQDEAERALARGVYLPVLIDEVALPLGFGGVQAISLVGWGGDANAVACRALVGNVRQMIDGSAVPAPGPVQRRVVGRRALVVGATAVAVAVAAVGVAVFAGRPIICAVVGECPPTGGASSVGVLPFRNNGAADQDYLAEGIAEELRGALSHLATIRVAARISSAAARKADADFRAIGRQLGVRYLVDGLVQRVGSRVRVDVSLIEADTRRETWSQIYEGPIGDLLGLQSGIAQSVAGALRGTLAPADKAAVTRQPTQSPEAYDAYLRGIRLFDLGGDEGTYKGALALFGRAVALDPGYAAAHAARARTLAAIANQFLKPGEIKPAYAKALAAAQTAVTLAPGSGEAQSALGYVRAYGFLDFRGARAPYRRSVALAPNSADILILYGTFAARVDDPATGIVALKRAIVLDPLNPRAYKALGYAELAARDYAGAVATLTRAIELSPGMVGAHGAIGDALYLRGDLTGAASAYAAEPQRYLKLVGDAIVRARTGDTMGAHAALAALIAEEGDSAAYQQAQVYAQWGQADAALAALERAHAAGDSGITSARNDPLLDPVRKDARLTRFLAGLGLA